MKFEKKVIIGLLVYVLTCAARLVFSNSSAISDSIYYITEHIFVIGILLLVSEYIYDSFQLTLIYGIILYKIELIIFNIYLAFMPPEKWDLLSKRYDISVNFTFTIWVIIFICLLIKKRL